MTNTGNEGMRHQAATEASQLKDTVKDEAADLTSTARAEGMGVVSEAKYQAKGVLDESVHQMRNQAGVGQQRLAEVVRSFSSEAGQMAGASTQSGMATKLAGDASRLGDDFASWLESHGPDDVMHEVRRFAARRPGTFLAIAAGAGLLVGRFMRGVRDEHSQDSTPRALTTGGDDPARYSSGLAGGDTTSEHAYSYSDDPSRTGTGAGWAGGLSSDQPMQQPPSMGTGDPYGSADPYPSADPYASEQVSSSIDVPGSGGVPGSSDVYGQDPSRTFGENPFPSDDYRNEPR